MSDLHRYGDRRLHRGQRTVLCQADGALRGCTGPHVGQQLTIMQMLDIIPL